MGSVRNPAEQIKVTAVAGQDGTSATKDYTVTGIAATDKVLAMVDATATSSPVNVDVSALTVTANKVTTPAGASYNLSSKNILIFWWDRSAG